MRKDSPKSANERSTSKNSRRRRKHKYSRRRAKKSRRADIGRKRCGTTLIGPPPAKRRRLDPLFVTPEPSPQEDIYSDEGDCWEPIDIMPIRSNNPGILSHRGSNNLGESSEHPLTPQKRDTEFPQVSVDRFKEGPKRRRIDSGARGEPRLYERTSASAVPIYRQPTEFPYENGWAENARTTAHGKHHSDDAKNEVEPNLSPIHTTIPDKEEKGLGYRAKILTPKPQNSASIEKGSRWCTSFESIRKRIENHDKSNVKNSSNYNQRKEKSGRESDFTKKRSKHRRAATATVFSGARSTRGKMAPVSVGLMPRPVLPERMALPDPALWPYKPTNAETLPANLSNSLPTPTSASSRTSGTTRSSKETSFRRAPIEDLKTLPNAAQPKQPALFSSSANTAMKENWTRSGVPYNAHAPFAPRYRPAYNSQLYFRLLCNKSWQSYMAQQYSSIFLPSHAVSR